MKKLKFNNTYSSGAVTYLIFKEKAQFVGVCLEFDLVVKAPTFKETEKQIEDYAYAWLENVVDYHLPETLLNKPAPKKYWRIYERARLEEETRKKQANINNSSIFPVAHSFQPYSPQFPLFA